MTPFLKLIPYAASFAGALVLTLVLTPIVREVNRRLGMVDKPDPRRINKVPIPRGGGVAIFLGVFISYAVFHLAYGRPFLQGIPDATFLRLALIALGVVVVGLADDRYSLHPLVKLAGQVLAAVLTWSWASLGFRDMWPWLPAWLDCVMTVFWLVGAMNAFNLIDGLDGLASGLALIATLGMAGGLFYMGNSEGMFFYFALAGGLVGFLRFNYNPASVFLGDSGSMFLGYVIATLPLSSHVPNSFLVSVGVPLLAMGVPIFDTALAILRRSIRHAINLRARGTDGGSGRVMTADSDHLHHRILRAVGFNQRKAAWTLYALAASLVAVGLVGMALKSRAAGLWLLAVAGASVVIFRDLARVELFDAGRLLNSVAHNRAVRSRRRWARLAVPFYLGFDILAIFAAFTITVYVLRVPQWRELWTVALPLRVTAVFAGLVFFRVYRTIWSRAMLSNYLRLCLACGFGSVLGGVVIYYATAIVTPQLYSFSLLFGLLAAAALLFVRSFRGIVRDVFYAIDCSRLVGRKDVSRILVYGTGLRYRAFRRELVRTTSANERIIVGLLDDDVLLRNHYIGGIKVFGTLAQAPEVINALNVDAVVIACEIPDEWLRIVKETLEPTGVKITHFSFSEKTV